MKKFRTGVLALALIAGITGAFASKASSAPKKFDQLYNWVHYDTDGNTIIGNDNQQSVAEEQASTHCTYSATRCAVGTAPGKPSVTLRYQF